MRPAERRQRATVVRLVGLGHVVAGAGALVVAAVMIHAGTRPYAGLGGVVALPGVVLGLAALAFTRRALRALRHLGSGRPLSEWRVLALVEIATGIPLAAAVAVAVQGYGAFEPWRSPLLLPSVALLVLGSAGLLVARDPSPRVEPAERSVA
ncbi:hypothetical protein [Knoellia aerolata]|nr:hypothetical protein [Knoellia aerolata]